MLGYPSVKLARPFHYSRDPFSGREWPERHGLRLDYRRAAVGDPKWIWELNRLQHVPLLLEAWLLEGDESFLEVAVSDLESWSRHRRPGFGIAWANGFEPALRAISLALACDALRAASQTRQEALLPWLFDLVDLHLGFIERYPSLHSSANNHRLGELAAIVVAARLIPELDADASVVRALEELELRTRQQFGADGTNLEQSFGYAVSATDSLLLAAAALSASGARPPTWIASTLQRSADAFAVQLAGGEPEPRYGDCDDGRSMLLDGEQARTGLAVCASLAAYLGHPEARAVAGTLDAPALWLFGQQGAETFKATQPRATARSGHLPDGGLVVLRAGKTTALFDTGPLGFGTLAAHGHADALQLTVVRDGDVLVGDPGTGSYFGSRIVRDAFRGTGFHATVTVDAEDQAVIAGPFLWKRRPKVVCEHVDLERRFAVASHDGYARLLEPVHHRRSVYVVDERTIVVQDILESSGRHTYSLRWPFPPEADAAADGDAIVCTVGSSRLTLRVACSAPLRVRVVKGQADPLCGWWSERLESMRPAPVAVLDAAGQGTTVFSAILTVQMAVDGWNGVVDEDVAEEAAMLVGMDGARAKGWS